LVWLWAVLIIGKRGAYKFLLWEGVLEILLYLYTTKVCF
jgi:hypothetical protein